MKFSGENYYVGHTSKKNNLWFWMPVSTPARWLTASHSLLKHCVHACCAMPSVLKYNSS